MRERGINLVNSTYSSLKVSQAIELYNKTGIAIVCDGDSKTYRVVYEDIRIDGDIQ